MDETQRELLEQLQQELVALRQKVQEQSEQLLSLHQSVAAQEVSGPVSPTASSASLFWSDNEDDWEGESESTRLEDALFPLARALSDAYDFEAAIQHPKDLEQREKLLEGASLLAESPLSERALLHYVGGGEHVMFGPMALEALTLRNAHLFDDVCERLPELEERGLHFALKYLHFAKGDDKAAAVLRRPVDWWAGNDAVCRSLRVFLLQEIRRFGLQPLEQEIPHWEEPKRQRLKGLIDALDIPALQPLVSLLKQPALLQAQMEVLYQIGRLWEPEHEEAILVNNPEQEGVVEQMFSMLTTGVGRSLVLHGKHGVGKTACIRQLFERLLGEGWLLFEASAADVLAGQRYVGELEGRVQKLLDALQKLPNVLWYVPDFHELLDKGATQQDPTGILDLILPAMERQKILVLGETQSEPFARLLRRRHKLHFAAEPVLLEPASLEASVAMAQKWAARMAQELGYQAVSSGVIEEAVQLSLQYMTDRSLPGSIMQLLQRASLQKQMSHSPTEEEGARNKPLSVEDLLTTIAQITHLPPKVLDDRQKLDIESLRDVFRGHVIGQDEAVECLVERIAMIKAGLTDPTRPLGVFLFAGPTGTGKTELAKTLCRFLFGSEQHMLRLDMSEYNDRDSYWRLIQSDDGQERTRSLATKIREQPFSVVLLDEVEKAHPNIWDLFLQVFDDGRLTDRSGNTVDFRHAIIILTSNVGSTIQTSGGVGFNTQQETFMPGSVRKAIEQTFRREFINRIDRTVVFNPLSRSVMRDILHKELNGLLLRRGFRSKEWAVEWGASAVDFLLEKGFTPDLGARPLKRAIERYLLAPLAKTIVEHRFPEGNQFLFVSSNTRRIQVKFIDPDVPAPEDDAVADERPLTPKGIAMQPEGRAEEWAFLKEYWQRLAQQINASHWQNEKAELQARMKEKDFIKAGDRYRVLEQIETMERIEAGLEAARGLERRIGASADYSNQCDSLRRLAQQLLLLDVAARDVLREVPQNALLHISGLPSKELPLEASFDVFQHTKIMYQSWAESRRMRSMWLRRGSLERMQAIFVVTGLGAWSILSPERGLHVFELPREDGTFHLTRVRVRVVPQPVAQTGSNQSILTYANDLFEQDEAKANTICRHYRWAPTPRVEDRVSQWRTEHIARVLAGDFDLFE